ncbi:MAG: NAD(P)-dependent oxidoreductase [Alphaproteobacteria bacterium]|nr:NAD(P)-dependent oxidoreductase [Alphaproteobacteria bacterium]
MTVLVIGKSSFISQSLCKDPIAQSWVYCDHDSANQDEIWSTPYSCVVNLALDPVVRGGDFSQFDRKVGLRAQENGAHYVALSSRAVYGISSELITFDENSRFLGNCTPYGRAKRLIEGDLVECLNAEKLTILRPSNIFGFEYASPTRRSFFGMMLNSLKERNEILFDMSGVTARDFLPVESFVDALVDIAGRPLAGVYNIGSGRATSCEDIAQWVIEGYGSGKLTIEKHVSVKDSFILDSGKFNGAYNKQCILSDQIKQSCIDIGKQLRDS